MIDDLDDDDLSDEEHAAIYRSYADIITGMVDFEQKWFPTMDSTLIKLDLLREIAQALNNAADSQDNAQAIRRNDEKLAQLEDEMMSPPARSMAEEQRWIGQGDGGRHIACPGRHHGDPGHHSLLAAFIG